MQQPVLSVPANKSEVLIHRWHLYMCPDKPRYTKHIENADFISFRHDIQGINGATNKIYRIVKKIKIDLKGKAVKEAVTALDLDGLNITALDLITYITQIGQDPTLKRDMRNSPHWLVFLSKTGNEDLQHLPRPIPNGPFWTIYSRGELRDNDILPSKS